MIVMSDISFFFFQAEDGIRDATVTGVQTCALPILQPDGARDPRTLPAPPATHLHVSVVARRAHRGHRYPAQPVAGGRPRGAVDATGRVRVRDRDGGERRRAPRGVDLPAQGDAGRVFGAAYPGGRALSARGDLAATVARHSISTRARRLIEPRPRQP